jgi:prepilin-type N-terminal cleavage/methylation domain-containing protein/prepilin-type processing-associated H-X9-DG protein
VRKRRAFTLIELLVVIAIIAVLMAVLMPALNRVKKQARSVACMARLKSWGLMFKFYSDDYDGKFNPGWDIGDGSGLWMNALRRYYKDNWKMLLCPTATRVDPSNQEGTFNAMQREVGGVMYTFSYGINSWTNCMTKSRDSRRTEDRFWKTTGVKGQPKIPVFADATWHDAWPFETDVPISEPWGFGGGDQGTTDEMNQFCIDRHNGWTNMLFMDWSVRHVGLKELWTLKWNRKYITSGKYTMAGGVQTSDWPQWLRKYKDY